jgi:hypothetical protein
MIGTLRAARQSPQPLFFFSSIHNVFGTAVALYHCSLHLLYYYITPIH